MSERMTPFHCPYCAEEDLRPHAPEDPSAGAGHGAWECRACLRAFKVSFLGLLPRPASAEAGR